MNFTLDTGVKALLPPQKDQERALLETALIREKGARDALVVAYLEDEQIHVLADGYNRYEICTEKKLPYKTIEMRFANRELLYKWVIENQLGQRNLTDEQRAYYIGRLYQDAKQEYGKSSRFSPSGQNVPLDKRTSKAIAEKEGINEKTVRRNAEFAEAVDALPVATKQQVLSGESGLTKAEVTEGKASLLCASCACRTRKQQEVPKNCPDCANIRGRILCLDCLACRRKNQSPPDTCKECDRLTGKRKAPAPYKPPKAIPAPTVPPQEDPFEVIEDARLKTLLAVETIRRSRAGNHTEYSAFTRLMDSQATLTKAWRDRLARMKE